MNSEGFKAWLETTDKTYSLGDYFTVLKGTAAAFAKLEEENARLREDLAAWLSLARRQYKEMEHNHPICPTSMGIKKTEELLGIE